MTEIIKIILIGIIGILSTGNVFALERNIENTLSERLEILYEKVDNKKLSQENKYKIYTNLVNKIDEIYEETVGSEKKEILNYLKYEISYQMIPADIEIIKDYGNSVQAAYSAQTRQVMILVNNKIILKSFAASVGQDLAFNEKESLGGFGTEFDFSDEYDVFHREKADEYISYIEVSKLDDELILIDNKQHFFYTQDIVNTKNNKKLRFKQKTKEDFSIRKNLLIIANYIYDIPDGVTIYDKNSLLLIQE